MKAKRRKAKEPPAIRVRLPDLLWDAIHRFPKENWSEVCRCAMERKVKALDKEKT